MLSVAAASTQHTAVFGLFVTVNVTQTARALDGAPAVVFVAPYAQSKGLVCVWCYRFFFAVFFLPNGLTSSTFSW